MTFQHCGMTLGWDELVFDLILTGPSPFPHTPAPAFVTLTSALVLLTLQLLMVVVFVPDVGNALCVCC